MPLSLYVDADRWRTHQHGVRERYPGIVPVAKGNGYGFANRTLAHEAVRLGVDLLAVGTVDEAAEVGKVFDRDLLVLTPYVNGFSQPQLPERTIRMVASVAALPQLSGQRVVVECRTSMRRHGIREQDLAALRAALSGVQFEGFSVHLPIDRPDGADPVGEVDRWIDLLRREHLPVPVMLVSHLEPPELQQLSERHLETRIRPRIGTALWLGDPGAVRCKATVLDIVHVRRGDRFGYRQRRATADGHLVVVAGGAGHGIGMDGPKVVQGVSPRVHALRRTVRAMVNDNRSPFVWAGQKPAFAEPPHTQVSMLFLQDGIRPPVVGDELDAVVRKMTTHFDRVILQDKGREGTDEDCLNSVSTA